MRNRYSTAPASFVDVIFNHILIGIDYMDLVISLTKLVFRKDP